MKKTSETNAAIKHMLTARGPLVDLSRLLSGSGAAGYLGLHRSTISVQTGSIDRPGPLRALRLRDGTAVYDVVELDRYRRENMGNRGRPRQPKTKART